MDAVIQISFVMASMILKLVNTCLGLQEPAQIWTSLISIKPACKVHQVVVLHHRTITYDVTYKENNVAVIEIVLKMAFRRGLVL